MLIQANDDQILKMAKLAILASAPVGLGFLHFDPTLTEDKIILHFEDDGLFVDYFQGRMVKFGARRESENGWKFADAISSDYQSWVRKYPDYQALYDATKD